MNTTTTLCTTAPATPATAAADAIAPRTTVLLFHPFLHKSKANATLAKAAASVPGVEIVDMYALYKDGNIDAATEIKRLLHSDRIVLQFPVQWYAPPALLQQWKDMVFTHMFYVAYENEGRHLEGTPLLIAATAGNTASSYTAEGSNRFGLSDMLKPLLATANRCRLPWAEPLFVYEANKLDEEALAQHGERYRQHLVDWMGAVH